MTNNQNYNGARKDAAPSTLKNTAQCACSGGAGLLAGHMGCIITPLALAAMGVTGVAATSPFVMIAAGAAITAASLGLWYGLRGRFAAALERRIVVVSAVAGFALMSAFNMTAAHKHGPGPGNSHNHDHTATRNWYNSQTPEAQERIKKSAHQLGLPLAEYINDICATPPAEMAGPENRLKRMKCYNITPKNFCTLGAGYDR
jgi:hypothetical protein